MDLAEILKKTKAKSERVTTIRKPPSIATEDRPYSITDEESFQPIAEQKFTPSKSLINIELKGTENPSATFSFSQIENKNFVNDDLTHTNLIIKTDNKSVTNREQTANKPQTNRKQTDNKIETKPQQPVSKTEVKNKNWQQTSNQTGNTIGNKLTTNWQQTGNKTAIKIAFSELVGLQRDIIILVCHECKNSRSRTTEALTLEYISIALKRSPGAIKTTIQRLEKKGCLFRVAFKNGRGGWSKYELPDSVYHDALRSGTDNKLTTNWQQTANKVASQPTTEPTTSTSSSSSILNIKETTTTQLNDEWNFDIAPYAKFGFMASQLKQLSSLGVISATDVEQSLIEFNHDLTNDMLPNIKTGKINFLMGLLRSGHSYVSENFKNEQETLISEMANRVESKRKKLLENKFMIWESSLSTEERKGIEDKIPLHLKVIFRAHGVSNLEIRNWLFNYYLQTGVL